MIAQGVRFNAEKKQVGNYYSTKVCYTRQILFLCVFGLENPARCHFLVIGELTSSSIYMSVFFADMELQNESPMLWAGDCHTDRSKEYALRYYERGQGEDSNLR